MDYRRFTTIDARFFAEVVFHAWGDKNSRIVFPFRAIIPQIPAAP